MPIHSIGFRARRPVSGKMSLPCRDLAFGLTAGGVDFFVKVLSPAALEIGDDVASVSPLGANLDAGDDTARFRPGPGCVGEGLEAAQLMTGIAGVAGCCQCLERQDVFRQTAVLGQAEDIAQPEPVTKIQNLRGTVAAVGS